MAERELAIVIRARDFATGVVRGVKGEMAGLDRVASRGLSNATRNLERVAVVAGGAAVAGLGYAVSAAMDFEAQLNTINTVADVTPERLEEIGAGIRAISRETGTSTEDLTAAYYDLVSAGIDAADAQGVLTAANTLAIGGLATTAEAVDLLTTAINIYGGDASRAGEFADYFAQAVAAGKVTAAELASSFAEVGPLAGAMGVEIEELAAAYGLMTAKGETASGTATSVHAALLALQRTTGPLEQMQRDLNVNFAEMAEQEGLAATWQLIAREAERTGIPLIELTGRAEALNFVLGVSGENADDYAAALDDVRKAHDGEGVAAAQMARRQEGLAFQLKRLKANVIDAAITVGTALLPILGDLAEEATGWLTTHQEDIKRFAENLAGGFRDLVGWVRGLDWEQIGEVLRGLAGIGQGLAEAFLGMPTWVQTAVLTGWGLNKLTGGAVGTILGSIASGLIKGVLGINAGVVNINAARVGGVPGTGGGGGVITSFLGLVTSVGLGAVIGTEIGRMLIAPTLQPAVTFEESQFDRLLHSNDPAALQRGLDGINEGIGDIEALGIAQLAFLPELNMLKEQRDLLTQQLEEVRASPAVVQAAAEAREASAAARRQQIMDQAQTRQQLANLANVTAVEGGRRATDASRHLAMLQRHAGALDGINAKNFSPTINVRQSTTLNISGRTTQAIITQAQLAVGKGPQEF